MTELLVSDIGRYQRGWLKWSHYLLRVLHVTQSYASSISVRSSGKYNRPYFNNTIVLGDLNAYIEVYTLTRSTKSFSCMSAIHYKYFNHWLSYYPWVLLGKRVIRDRPMKWSILPLQRTWKQPCTSYLCAYGSETISTLFIGLLL